MADPDLDALLTDHGIAKAMREYNRADDYGKITADHAAVVLARKVAQYAHHVVLEPAQDEAHNAAHEPHQLPGKVIEPLLDFLAAEKARNDVIGEGKLPMFSDRRKEVWDTMRSTAHALAQTLQT